MVARTLTEVGRHLATRRARRDARAVLVLNEASPRYTDDAGGEEYTASAVELARPLSRGLLSLDLCFCFALVAHGGGGQKRSVVLELPDKYVEQSHLGMRRRPRPKSAARDAVRVDDQYRFQVVDIGCVAARQRTIELAIVIDEDCMELGTERSPTSVASWGDGRRPPLYWVGSDPGERGPVLMYERRHFFEDD